jgi:hypothetical protein
MARPDCDFKSLSRSCRRCKEVHFGDSVVTLRSGGTYLACQAKRFSSSMPCSFFVDSAGTYLAATAPVLDSTLLGRVATDYICVYISLS